MILVHGNFPLRAEEADVDRATNHQWISSLSLKAKNEGFILVAQDQDISARAYQLKTLNNSADPNFGLWTGIEETVNHIV